MSMQITNVYIEKKKKKKHRSSLMCRSDRCIFLRLTHTKITLRDEGKYRRQAALSVIAKIT